MRDLHRSQANDGSWPAFVGDQEGCWVTALVVLTLLAFNDWADTLRHAGQWLLDSKGREAHWLWQFKFRAIDTSVQFDTSKYGWSWVPGTTSWVIPTAFSVVALKALVRAGILDPTRVRARIELGLSMLLDRMCSGGGWNAGNRAAFGVAYAPYLDATAVALLALREHEADPGVQQSLSWLEVKLSQCPSPYSRAWGVLALTAFQHPAACPSAALRAAVQELSDSAKEVASGSDTATIALTALALQAVAGDNVFEVLVWRA